MRFSFSKPGKSTSTPILSPSRESRFPSSVWAHNPHSHGYHTCQGEPHWEFRLHAGGQKRINMQLCSNTFRHSLTLIKKKNLPSTGTIPKSAQEQRISTIRWSETKPRQTSTKFNIQRNYHWKNHHWCKFKNHHQEAKATKRTFAISSKSTWLW